MRGNPAGRSSTLQQAPSNAALVQGRGLCWGAAARQAGAQRGGARQVVCCACVSGVLWVVHREAGGSSRASRGVAQNGAGGVTNRERGFVLRLMEGHLN